MANDPEVNVPYSLADLKLEDSQLEQLGDLPPAGSKVRIVLIGTVKAVAEAQKDRMDEAARKATLQIDVSTIRLADSNYMAELFEDDLSG